MLKKDSVYKKIFFLFFLFLALPACVFNTTGINSQFNLASVGDGFAPSDSEFFYFDLDVDSYESNDEIVPYYEISTTENFGQAAVRDSSSNCEIEYTPLEEGEEPKGSENLVCILDMMEQAFFLRDLPLVYNVPEGMCAFVYVSVPWHYNYQTERGPVNVYKVTIEGDEATDIESGEYYGALGIGWSKDIESLCIYTAENSDEYCCTGDYVVYDIGNSADFPVISESTTGNLDERGEWDEGGITHCLGGPGRNWVGYDSNGIPTRVVYNVLEDGIKNTIEINSLYNVNRIIGGGASTPIANYLKALDEEPEDLRDISRSDLPEFLRLPTGLSQVYAPELFFTLECLDQAGEVLHRLDLMIREWNTYEEFIEFYNEGGNDDSDPDVSGIEGEDCKYEDRKTIDEDSFTNQCNDFCDFDDFVNQEEDCIASHPDRTPVGGDGNPLIFPRIPYEEEASSSDDNSDSDE